MSRQPQRKSRPPRAELSSPRPCGICLEEIRPRAAFVDCPVGGHRHRVHARCFRGLREGDQRCPHCRVVYPPEIVASAASRWSQADLDRALSLSRLDPRHPISVEGTAAIERGDFDLDTTFFLAVWFERMDLAQEAIEAGANVRVTNAAGQTALFVAVRRGSAEMVRFLLRVGVPVNQPSNDGTVPLMLARSLEVAAILVEGGANVNHQRERDGATPLFLAVGSGQEERVRLLLANGANVNFRSRTNQTALLSALARGDQTIARMLMDAGATVEATDDAVSLAYGLQTVLGWWNPEWSWR